MTFYFKMQILNYTTNEKLSHYTNELRQFCAMFQLKVFGSDYFDDTLYAVLPADDYGLTQVVNALHAYCAFCEIGHQLVSDKISVPLEDYFKNMNDKLNND